MEEYIYIEDLQYKALMELFYIQYSGNKIGDIMKLSTSNLQCY
jgi:hypothetical protein